MKNPIVYIVINKELKMSGGKAAAQAVHAAMMLENNSTHVFSSYARRTVVVLEAPSSEIIKNLSEYLSGAGIYSAYYIDEGLNEVSSYSVTALAVEPVDAEDDRAREIFEGFELYSVYHWEPQITTSADMALINLCRVSEYESTPWFVKLTKKWLKKRT